MDVTLVVLSKRKQRNVIYSSIYRYLSAIKAEVRVRTRKWERLYRMRAQSGVYRFDICVSRSRVIFFFLFFLKLLSSLKPQSDISLINGRYAFREGERKSRISCDPFESAEKIGGWWKETNIEFWKRYEIWIEFHVSNENSKLHFWRKNCYSGGGMSFIWI